LLLLGLLVLPAASGIASWVNRSVKKFGTSRSTAQLHAESIKLWMPLCSC